MGGVDSLRVRPFEPRDQIAARRLILEGLGSHFGHIDESMNPDLDDIAASYASAVFLVAEHDGRIVGTGALTPEPDRRAGAGRLRRIQRMSTAAGHRRRGVATAVLRALLDHARERGYGDVVLSTVERWDDAVAFYTAAGFQITHRTDDGDVHFAIQL